MSLPESHPHSFLKNFGDLDTPESEDDIEPEFKGTNTNSQQGLCKNCVHVVT